MEMDTSSREIVHTTPPSVHTTRHMPVTSVGHVVKDYGVEELSVIVWCVGGVLLVSLLALLGRIILARRKDPLADMPRQQSHSVFSIRIDAQTSHDTYPPSRDTLDLVPGSDVPVIDSPTPHRGLPNGVPELTEQQRQHQQQSLSEPHSQTSTTNNSASIQQSRSTNDGNYPATPLAGCMVSINGLVIRPPPYSAVIASDTRLPSVVVGRNQSQRPRRMMLSL